MPRRRDEAQCDMQGQRGTGQHDGEKRQISGIAPSEAALQALPKGRHGKGQERRSGGDRHHQADAACAGAAPHLPRQHRRQVGEESPGLFGDGMRQLPKDNEGRQRHPGHGDGVEVPSLPCGAALFALEEAPNGRRGEDGAPEGDPLMGTEERDEHEHDKGLIDDGGLQAQGGVGQRYPTEGGGREGGVHLELLGGQRGRDEARQQEDHEAIVSRPAAKPEANQRQGHGCEEVARPEQELEHPEVFDADVDGERGGELVEDVGDEPQVLGVVHQRPGVVLAEHAEQEIGAIDGQHPLGEDGRGEMEDVQGGGRDAEADDEAGAHWRCQGHRTITACSSRMVAR